VDATPDAKPTPPAPTNLTSGEIAALKGHTPSSMFLWVLGLTAFTLNLGYGIVIPISEELARRCGSGGEAGGELAAFSAIAVALISFNLAKVLGEVPGGIFSDRIGDRVVLASSLFIYGISVIMLVEARSYFPFTAARFIEGCATGVSYPSMTSVLIRHSPREKLGRNMSIGLGAGVLGIIVGPVIAGPLIKLNQSWHLVANDIDFPLWIAFVLTVVVFALAVGWFWTAATRSKKGDLSDIHVARRATAADSYIVAGPGPTLSQPAPVETFMEGVIREFRVIGRFARSPAFLGLLSPLFFDKMVMCAWQVLLFAHVKTIGIPGVDPVGYLMSLLALSFAVVTPVSGFLSDRFPARLLALGSLIGIVATLALMVLAPSGATFTPLWVLYSIFSAMLLTVHLKMVGDIYHEEQQHGRIFGIVHALSDLGMIFGPPFIWLYTVGKVGRILTFAILAGLGFLTIPAFAISQGREKQLPRP
jgi:MFS family permease